MYSTRLTGQVMKNYTTSIIFAGLLTVASSSFADPSESYLAQVGEKTLNGFTNVTTAVLEIPKNIINVSNRSNVVYGVLGGVTQGVLNTLGRLTTGVIDIVTAPIPTQPIAEPAYIWDDFDEDTRYGAAFRLKK